VTGHTSGSETISWRRALSAGVAAAIVAAGIYFLPVADWTISLAERARGTGAAGVVLFFVVYVLSTVALLPGSILTLAAGFAYGPVWGLAVASPASVAGATCAFLLGRTALRDWAARKVSRSRWARSVDAAVGREGFKLVLLLRLSPLIPFNLLNYILSLTRVTTGGYVLGSFIGMLPGTAVYVYLGSLAPAAAELSRAAAGRSDARTSLYAAGLAATVAVAVITTRAARRALQSEFKEAGD
jgi:uncharacterized membrane protein YdjX (TVP38/TMEM64 family)